MTGYSITVIPNSWVIGKIQIRNKFIWSFGPFRFSIHRKLSTWEDIEQ